MVSVSRPRPGDEGSVPVPPTVGTSVEVPLPLVHKLFVPLVPVPDPLTSLQVPLPPYTLFQGPSLRTDREGQVPTPGGQE